MHTIALVYAESFSPLAASRVGLRLFACRVLVFGCYGRHFRSLSAPKGVAETDAPDNAGSTPQFRIRGGHRKPGVAQVVRRRSHYVLKTKQ